MCLWLCTGSVHNTGWPRPGSIPSAGHLFRYVTNQPPKDNSAFNPSGVGKWIPASAGKAKAGMVYSVSGWMQGVQVKLWDPLRTCDIHEHLRGVFTTRHYTNPHLSYLTLQHRTVLIISLLTSRQTSQLSFMRGVMYEEEKKVADDRARLLKTELQKTLENEQSPWTKWIIQLVSSIGCFVD